MVSLCDIGSRGGCVGLLWAVDAQRDQCSLAAREAERLATEMLAAWWLRGTCKIKPASTYCQLTSHWCICLYLCKVDFSWFLLKPEVRFFACLSKYDGHNSVYLSVHLYAKLGIWLSGRTSIHTRFYHYFPGFECPMTLIHSLSEAFSRLKGKRISESEFSGIETSHLKSPKYQQKAATIKTY